MNAVLEKPPAKVRGRKAAPAASATGPAPLAKTDAILFAEVGDFLALASSTDEDHAFSGESDRLLSIGAMIALDAAKGQFSNTDAENTAYDVAACINSARLVPDDDESVERTLHINNAAERLAIITGMQVHRMIFTDVPRPTRTPAPTSESKHKQFTQDQRNELHRLAYAYMECASSVISQYAEHANSEEVFAIRDLLGTYCESTDEAIKAAEPGDGPLADTSADLSKIINLFHAVNDDERSDQILHGVNYLLMSAKRMVDGDLGVLDE
ncbi:hypothetical protein [Comamonas sp.]|uniref:hypothetical protein n=1 Tax=Comamonas sp. TaxID=34028 RepID=UPI00289DE6B1|nr:hypothetical protein [Comamonas sp.]